jgi:hypothetical protein
MSNEKNKPQGNKPAANKPATDAATKGPRRAPPPPGKKSPALEAMLTKGCTLAEYAKEAGLNASSAKVRLKKAIESGRVVASAGDDEENILDTLFTAGSAARTRTPKVYTLVPKSETTAPAPAAAAAE